MEALPSEPAATFTQRCAAAVAAAAAAGRPFNAVYVSQVTFLTQRTLIPDIPALARSLHAAAAGQGVHAALQCGAQPTEAAVNAADARRTAEEPLIIIDGGRVGPDQLLKSSGHSCHISCRS